MGEGQRVHLLRAHAQLNVAHDLLKGGQGVSSEFGHDVVGKALHLLGLGRGTGTPIAYDDALKTGISNGFQVVDYLSLTAAAHITTAEGADFRLAGVDEPAFAQLLESGVVSFAPTELRGN